MKTLSRERRATVNYGKLSEDQIRKLRQDLEIAGGNLDIFNELLTELSPGEEHPEDKKLLDDLGATCREMQRRVVELLGLVENRDLTSQLLDVNDNINNQLLRYERYNKNSSAPAVSNVTSTDDVLLEVAAGPISHSTEEPILGAMALAPRKPKQDFQDVDLLGTDEPPSSDKKQEGISKT